MNIRFLAVASLIVGAMNGFALAQDQQRTGAPAQGGASADQRALAYYNVTMGHLYEQDFDSSGPSEDAAKASDFYKIASTLVHSLLQQDQDRHVHILISTR